MFYYKTIYCFKQQQMPVYSRNKKGEIQFHLIRAEATQSFFCKLQTAHSLLSHHIWLLLFQINVFVSIPGVDLFLNICYLWATLIKN